MPANRQNVPEIFRPDGALAASYGIVFMHGTFRRRKADNHRIVKPLEALLKEHEADDGLKSQEYWLNPKDCSS